MRQAVVTFGRDADGDMFNMHFPLPDRAPVDRPATERQRAAVEAFYCHPLAPDLTDGQAHAVLTARDYGRATAERLHPRVGGARRTLLAQFVAAYLLANPDMAADVTRWLAQRFDDGADPDKLVSAISRTKHFRAVEAFLADAVADMRDAGCTAL